MDSVQLIKELNKKRYIKILSTIIILIVLTVGAVRVYYLTYLYNQVKNNQLVQVEEIIEESTIVLYSTQSKSGTKTKNYKNGKLS